MPASSKHPCVEMKWLRDLDPDLCNRRVQRVHQHIPLRAQSSGRDFDGQRALVANPVVSKLSQRLEIVCPPGRRQFVQSQPLRRLSFREVVPLSRPGRRVADLAPGERTIRWPPAPAKRTHRPSEHQAYSIGRRSAALPGRRTPRRQSAPGRFARFASAINAVGDRPSTSSTSRTPGSVSNWSSGRPPRRARFGVLSH